MLFPCFHSFTLNYFSFSASLLEQLWKLSFIFQVWLNSCSRTGVPCYHLTAACSSHQNEMVVHVQCLRLMGNQRKLKKPLISPSGWDLMGTLGWVPRRGMGDEQMMLSNWEMPFCLWVNLLSFSGQKVTYVPGCVSATGHCQICGLTPCS